MAILGNRDTRDNVVLTGIDAALLDKYRLADGTTYEQVVALANSVLSGFNGGLLNDPFWSLMVSYTDRPDTTYNVGNTASMVAHTEYGRPDPERADRAGHMLPLRKWDYMLGWTADYLEEARMPDIEADLAMAVEAASNRWRMALLGRLFKRGDDSGAANGLSTTGLSPGFATAAASTGVDFVPPSYGGTTFTSAHEHYVAIAGGAFTAAVFTDAKAELQEHGHEPPFEFIIGPSDETTVSGLTGFVAVNEALINQAITSATATFTGQAIMGKRPIGAIEGFRVWVVPGVPQYYGFGWKSYGRNSLRNPLAVRLPEGARAPQLRMFRDHNNPGIYAIQNLMTQMHFGVGVSDRTNGTPRYVNNANWADGTAA
jgi:hypothetical protein